MLYTILVAVQVIVSISLVGLILMQHGKGADAGAAFGSGASGTVFGSQGSANFLSRATAGLATLFFAISLTLAYLVGGDTEPSGESVIEQLEVPGSELLDDAPAGAPQTPATEPEPPAPAPATPADRLPE